MQQSGLIPDRLTIPPGIAGGDISITGLPDELPGTEIHVAVGDGFDPVAARFAYDPDPNNTFTLRNDGEDRAYSQIAVGSSAIFKGGVSGFFQYQQVVGYDNLSAYQVQAGIRYEF